MQLRKSWILPLSFVLAAGCTGRTILLPNPPEATVRVDGKPLAGNALTYGRFVGNSYDVEVSAPGFKTQHLKTSPELGNRATAITLVCVATIVGIPLIPFILPWNGEIDDRLYVSLQPVAP